MPARHWTSFRIGWRYWVGGARGRGLWTVRPCRACLTFQVRKAPLKGGSVTPLITKAIHLISVSLPQGIIVWEGGARGRQKLTACRKIEGQRGERSRGALSLGGGGGAGLGCRTAGLAPFHACPKKGIGEGFLKCLVTRLSLGEDHAELECRCGC